MERRANLNTYINLGIMILVGLVGWFGRDELETIKANQDRLWQTMMPRAEIEIRLATIESARQRQDNDLTSIRTELSRLQLDFARYQRDSK